MHRKYFSNLSITAAFLITFLELYMPSSRAAGVEKSSTKWVQSIAHVIPKQTATEGEGYFSIIEGHNGRLYIGTHVNGVNSYLVEFDPRSKNMGIVVDAHKAIGTNAKGLASQAKIHTRNNVGASGKIYFATKQGYPVNKNEKPTDYPGGYPMVYDPASGKVRVYPIPVPHHGIISITPDETRNVAYISTCSDEQPINSSHFMILALATGKYRDLMDCQHMFAFIVVDYMGRALHPVLGGDIVRYDPKADRLERLQQTIDGKVPDAASHLKDPGSHPINWDISPDGKTLYAIPMSTNQLYSYDLTAKGNVLPGRSLGALIPGAKVTDCRALCVGPSSQVWAAVTANKDGIEWPHLVSFLPGAQRPGDHGLVAVSNPNFTEFTDKAGKPLPFHAGFYKTPEGVTTTRYVTMGVCEGKDGTVYVLVLHPYTLLQILPKELQ